MENFIVAGDEQPYRPRDISSSEMMILQLKPKTFIFMDCIAYWWGWYGCSSPSTKGLHGWDLPIFALTRWQWWKDILNYMLIALKGSGMIPRGRNKPLITVAYKILTHLSFKKWCPSDILCCGSVHGRDLLVAVAVVDALDFAVDHVTFVTKRRKVLIYRDDELVAIWKFWRDSCMHKSYAGTFQRDLSLTQRRKFF